MSRIYIIRSFSLDASGALAEDPPTWSRDPVFAASLAQSLARRKAGVIAIGTSLDEEGMLGASADILSAYGAIPTTLIVRDAPVAAQASAQEEPRPARRLARA